MFFFGRHENSILCRRVSSYIRFHLLRNYGLDVGTNVKIGGGLRIEHPVGIVIGRSVEIGTHCTIMQGVTIGLKNISDNDIECPKIGDSVFIGPNVSVLGKIIVGSNTYIKAHSLVTSNFNLKKQ
jgi:serine O-acetyltransferase